ncbi:MAG: ribokinase [Oscillospiraceae bacterium]
MKILCFGSMNIDKVYQVDSIVKEGETILSHGYGVFPGGKGLNQSIAAAKAGAECYHAGAVGIDGDILLDVLQEAGVHTEFIEKMEDCPSGHTIIQVDKNGQNCIIVDGGANHRIKNETVDRVLKNFSSNDALLLQNELGNVGYVMEKAGKKGLKVYFNPSPVTDSIREYPLRFVDMFLINEIEGGYLTGETTPKKILESMHRKYPKAKILLTLGKKGSCYTDGEGIITIESFEVKVKDTTAAGDTFTGYLIAGIAAGKSMAENMRIATAASAIAVSRKGAASSVPHMAEVKNFIKEREGN